VLNGLSVSHVVVLCGYNVAILKYWKPLPNRILNSVPTCFGDVHDRYICPNGQPLHLTRMEYKAEKAGRQEEADIIKRISPIAWRHVNFLGRFEFQKQPALIDIDEITLSLHFLVEPPYAANKSNKVSG